MNAPQSGPPGGELVTDSSDSIIVAFDGLGDTTLRPRRPNVPRDWPTRPPRPETEVSDSLPGT